MKDKSCMERIHYCSNPHIKDRRHDDNHEICVMVGTGIEPLDTHGPLQDCT